MTDFDLQTFSHSSAYLAITSRLVALKMTPREERLFAELALLAKYSYAAGILDGKRMQSGEPPTEEEIAGMERAIREGTKF